jgi:hypothetical protein
MRQVSNEASARVLVLHANISNNAVAMLPQASASYMHQPHGGYRGCTTSTIRCMSDSRVLQSHGSVPWPGLIVFRFLPSADLLCLLCVDALESCEELRATTSQPDFHAECDDRPQAYPRPDLRTVAAKVAGQRVAKSRGRSRRVAEGRKI